ncbi:uncharacterized protein LOC134095994 isoform X2 [Sardina pilchardus]|uniref:uncharacterized protein LOC134095994 isoform X2 n=1 Tax=Sardina pilchardus TaxID=27697 RepID=UPI002E11C040
MDLGHPVSSGCNVTETQQVDQTRVIIKEEDIQEEEYDQEDEEQPFAELHCRTETDVTESNASDNEAQQTTAEIEVKIEEDDEPDNSNLVENMAESTIRPKRRRSDEHMAKKRVQEKERGKSRVYIGEAMQRWRELRQQKGFQSDAQLALFLLDSYEEYLHAIRGWDQGTFPTTTIGLDGRPMEGVLHSSAMM